MHFEVYNYTRILNQKYSSKLLLYEHKIEKYLLHF